MVVRLNKNSFCRTHRLTLFCIETNLRENRFFAARWAIGEQKATHNVKFYAEKRTKIGGVSEFVGQ